jgi:hypothetical protein
MNKHNIGEIIDQLDDDEGLLWDLSDATPMERFQIFYRKAIEALGSVLLDETCWEGSYWETRNLFDALAEISRDGALLKDDALEVESLLNLVISKGPPPGGEPSPF